MTIWVLSFPSFHHEIMSKLRQNGLIEDLTSTQCRDSCLSTNYYDDWTSFAKLAVRTHIPDFDGLKHYMGDHAVLIVKAWYKLTWGFIHRHLGSLKVLLPRGQRPFYICRLWNTISCLFICCIILKWSAQETTEACDWVIGTHISDKWRPYAFGLIDIFACY